MGRHLIKAGAGALALVAGLASATDAFAVRNRYTQEQSSELGIAIMDALDARDAEGRPVRTPRYPSEFYGREASKAQPFGASPFDDGR